MSELDGRKGGHLVAWTDKVEVLQMRKNVFCMKLEVRVADEQSSFWVIFVHTSVESRKRKQQWEFFQSRRSGWGSQWVIGGILMISRRKRKNKRK